MLTPPLTAVATSSRHTLAYLFVALLITSMSTSQALAAPDDDKKFGIDLGVFLTDRESQVNLDGPNGNAVIDLEPELGLEATDNVGRLDGFYRFAKKHKINFSVFDLSRTAKATIEEEFEWNDEVWEIDTDIRTDFDLRIYKAAYVYDFLSRDRGSLGVSGGFYVSDITFKLAATDFDRSGKEDLTAPLPVIGLRGAYALSDRWTLRGSAEVFAYKVDDVGGNLYDVYVGADYRFAEHFAAGLAVNGVEIDIDATSKRDVTVEYEWRYSGVLLYLRFDF